MPGLLADLVDELRTVGIPVSVGEHVDAAGAIAAIPLQDKDVLRAALQAALVKNAEHLSAFNLIFDLYTSGSEQSDAGPLASLSDAELRDALRDNRYEVRVPPETAAAARLAIERMVAIS